MNFELVALESDNELIQSIAAQLGKQIIVPQVNQFADGEREVLLSEHADQLRDKTVFVMQSTCPPVHDNIITIALLVHALYTVGVSRIIAVIPYFGYARQHESDIPGKRGAVDTIINMLEATGIDTFVCVELHTPELEEFFSIPIYNINLDEYIIEHIQQHIPLWRHCCLVAPDKGVLEKVQSIAKRLDLDVLAFSKKRYEVDKTMITLVSGESTKKNAIIIDDMISTGSTALGACDELVKRGFENIYGYFIHPVFAGDAQDKIERSKFTNVFVSNSIPLSKRKKSKIDVFDISKVLVDLILQRLV